MTRQRVCRLCGYPLAEQKPPYLIVDASGTIAGPLHSGCADKIVRGGEEKWRDYRNRAHRFGRLIPLDPPRSTSDMG